MLLYPNPDLDGLAMSKVLWKRDDTHRLLSSSFAWFRIQYSNPKKDVTRSLWVDNLEAVRTNSGNKWFRFRGRDIHSRLEDAQDWGLGCRGLGFISIEFRAPMIARYLHATSSRTAHRKQVAHRLLGLRMQGSEQYMVNECHLLCRRAVVMLPSGIVRCWQL